MPTSPEHNVTASGSSSAVPIPRLAFPKTRSRPTSIVDTTTVIEPAIDTASTLSASPSSSIGSFGTSPRKHTQSAIDRLTNAQQKDAAAAAKSHRVRTASSTSRSSTEGSSSTKLPSLIKSAASLSPAKPTTATLSASDIDSFPRTSPPRQQTAVAHQTAKQQRGSEAEASTSALLPKSEGCAAAMTESTFADKKTASSKVAGLPSAKQTTRSKPNAPPLVALLADSSTSKLIKQGAEAKVYISRITTDDVLTWPQPSFSELHTRTGALQVPVLLKWRFPKTYRHPTLSRNITASRTIMEARALLRCAKAGVAVPSVRCVDEKEGILGLELIDGRSVREWLGGGAEGEEGLQDDNDAEGADEDDEPEVLAESEQIKLMQLIGRQLAIMHEADIVHGDLTTSNMMFRRADPTPTSGPATTTTIDLDRDEIVLIDFGLSSVSAFAEDKAVDLYVLERAFASTHPASEGLFQTILDTYAKHVSKLSRGQNRGKGGKLDKWEETRRKLEEVRLRGRKRSMVGSAWELWKENRDSRLVINFELALTAEARGIMAAVRSTPRLFGAVLRLRPAHLVRILPSPSMSRSSILPSRRAQRPDKSRILPTESQWHQLSSKMDHELEAVGSTQLLQHQHQHQLHGETKTSFHRREAQHGGQPDSQLGSRHHNSWLLLNLSMVPFQSTDVLTRVPFAKLVESVTVAAVETIASLASRVVGSRYPRTTSPSHKLKST
ncbi:hypothetical protein BCV70DRAFT_197149 [Testicularia cyperi]|uniref:non-specific serine/threonine protein kinase n=1 Tax=Testicularia cyperi TaxID=1882483 RepID=A0A317XXQ2_9BASI|nr:hypothetical protein BCV70DRAFT_197149 [Testicularia cyperi]